MRSRSRSSLAVRSRSCLAIVALAVAAAACGSDSSTGPIADNGVRADLGQAFDELGHPALSSAMGSLAGVFVPPGSSSGCPYTASSQSFVCPALSQSGISLAFSYAFLDASGASQSAFGATTTNSVRTSAVVGGTTTDLDVPFSINGRQDLTLSGLLSKTHTLNGSSDFHFTGSINTGSGSTPIAFRTKTTIADIVLPTGTNAFPVSGTISAEETLDGSTAVERAKITFNGTGNVTLVFTYSDGTISHCTLNLTQNSERCTD